MTLAPKQRQSTRDDPTEGDIYLTAIIAEKLQYDNPKPLNETEPKMLKEE